MPTKKIYTSPYFLLFLFACIGFAFSWIYASDLQKNAIYFGPFVVALITPFICAIFFLLACTTKQMPVKGLIILSLIVFIVAALPLLPQLNNKIFYPQTDDGYQYNATAHYIVDHKTLWGADGILPQYHGARHYTFNPGYRYFLALELFIFKNDTRGLQLFNLLLWVIATAFFVRQLSLLFVQGLEKYLVLFFIAGTTFYAPKNILMNLSEWFCILLFILFFLSYFNKKILLASICLGLIVFTRQNLLFASLSLFLLTLKGKSIKQITGYTSIYVILLSLPLLHNIYYAHTWQWLPGYVGGLKI